MKTFILIVFVALAMLICFSTGWKTCELYAAKLANQSECAKQQSEQFVIGMPPGYEMVCRGEDEKAFKKPDGWVVDWSYESWKDVEKAAWYYYAYEQKQERMKPVAWVTPTPESAITPTPKGR